MAGVFSESYSWFRRPVRTGKADPGCRKTQRKPAPPDQPAIAAATVVADTADRTISALADFRTHPEDCAMNDDEKAIRQVVDTWMTASKSGDLATVLSLMTDDVIFTVPGQEPFGKAAFAKASQGMAGARIDGTSEILELQLLGDWAFIRNRIEMSATSPGGSVHRSGYTLTLLRKEKDGQWRLARDANLVTTKKEETLDRQ
ncbi:SgcJ/EcaC family oxidoreductase [Mesorhizobium sp. Cs1299R1N1]|uniref:YybH family protein n=1 Tax=Mesorhizobium sp. Cs1299R1N1 TaxID=3015172 RepID=UPI00301C7AF2